MDTFQNCYLHKLKVHLFQTQALDEPMQIITKNIFINTAFCSTLREYVGMKQSGQTFLPVRYSAWAQG